MTETHRNESPGWLGWAATAAGGVGLLFVLAVLGQPMILVGSFDVVIPAILGVTAIVLALRVGKPHRVIGLITGGLTVLIALVVLGLLLFTDPWDEDDDVVDEQSSSSSSSSESKQPEAKQGQLVESGFGQSGESVGLAAIIKNVSDHAGQTINVSFNIKDEDGKLLKTEQDSGYFSFKGQELAIVTEAYLDEGDTVGSVETTLVVEDSGDGETGPNLGKANAELVTDGWGDSVAKVKVKNPTKQTLRSPYLAVVCRDGGKKIAGGGYSSPDLIGGGSEYAEDVSVTVSADAKSCKVYMTGGS